MRNKIAGNSAPSMKISGFEFTYHKYYSPQNRLEDSFCSCGCFKRTIAEHKGLFTCKPDCNTTLFAIKFVPGLNEFPFIEQIDNTLYKDSYILLGVDTKKQAYFMPVL